jgi:Mlc titration factor MtfA (ptsG expression regulator)
MKLQPWQVAVAPFGFLALIFLYLTIKADGEGVSIALLVAMTVIVAVIYVMSPQINWWWWQRSPPPLDERSEQFLVDYCAFYRPLSPEMKQRFRNRVALYLLGNEFMRPVHPNEMDADVLRTRVPEDLKVAVAASAVQVSFGKPKFAATKFEHIILYPHPFPSPQSEAIHTCEIYEPDGVLMLDADTLMAGFNRPSQIFSIGLYEMARIFKIEDPSVSKPILDVATLETLEKVSKMTRSQISTVVGLSDLDDFAVVTYHFFTFPHRFQSVLPDLYQLFVNIFHQNPMDAEHPVVNY